jgi:hypothetical protein
MTLDQAWRLSKLWYGQRLDPDFRRPTVSEAQRIFEQVGLVGAFWELDQRR